MRETRSPVGGANREDPVINVGDAGVGVRRVAKGEDAVACLCEGIGTGQRGSECCGDCGTVDADRAAAHQTERAAEVKVIGASDPADVERIGRVGDADGVVEGLSAAHQAHRVRANVQSACPQRSVGEQPEVEGGRTENNGALLQVHSAGKGACACERKQSRARFGQGTAAKERCGERQPHGGSPGDVHGAAGSANIQSAGECRCGAGGVVDGDEGGGSTKGQGAGEGQRRRRRGGHRVSQRDCATVGRDVVNARPGDDTGAAHQLAGRDFVGTGEDDHQAAVGDGARGDGLDTGAERRGGLAALPVEGETVEGVVSVERQDPAAVEGDVGGGGDLAGSGAHRDGGVVDEEVARDDGERRGTCRHGGTVEVSGAGVGIANGGGEQEGAGSAKDEGAARDFRIHGEGLAAGGVGQEELGCAGGEDAGGARRADAGAVSCFEQTAAREGEGIGTGAEGEAEGTGDIQTVHRLASGGESACGQKFDVLGGAAGERAAGGENVVGGEGAGTQHPHALGCVPGGEVSAVYDGPATQQVVGEDGGCSVELVEENLRGVEAGLAKGVVAYQIGHRSCVSHEVGERQCGGSVGPGRGGEDAVAGLESNGTKGFGVRERVAAREGEIASAERDWGGVVNPVVEGIDAAVVQLQGGEIGGDAAGCLEGAVLEKTYGSVAHRGEAGVGLGIDQRGDIVAGLGEVEAASQDAAESCGAGSGGDQGGERACVGDGAAGVSAGGVNAAHGLVAAIEVEHPVGDAQRGHRGDGGGGNDRDGVVHAGSKVERPLIYDPPAGPVLGSAKGQGSVARLHHTARGVVNGGVKLQVAHRVDVQRRPPRRGEEAACDPGIPGQCQDTIGPCDCA